MTTKIQWATHTINPLVGCDRKGGDWDEWPRQEGGNLDWIRPFQVKAIDGDMVRMHWIGREVPIWELRKI